MSTIRKKLPVGSVIKERYRVQRELGDGGMGTVYEALDETLGRRIALKVLHAELADDEILARRFTNEARALANIRSTHIVEIYDASRTGRVGNHKDAPFMAMEFLEGCDLSQILMRERRLPVQEAVCFVLQALVGIAEAHARGIVHRDLKPANLFLADETDGSQCIKVLDFGISKVSGELGSSQRMTTDASVLGTPAYMPPEQLRQSNSVGVQADIWSIGVILYELLSGRLPFDKATNGALFAAILVEEAQPVRTHAPHVPEELDRIILRCLEKEENARWPNVAELAAALGQFGPAATAESARRIERLASNIARSSVIPSDPAIVSSRLPDEPYAEEITETEHSAVATLHKRVPRRGELTTRVVYFGVGVALVGAVLGVGFGLRARASDEPVTRASVDQPPVAIAAEVPLTTASPNPSLPLVKRVRITVSAPSDVKVVYDGKSVTLDANRSLEVEGEVGSWQSVKLIRGAIPEERTVLIKNDGTAEPAVIEFAQKAKMGVPAAKPSGSSVVPAKPNVGPVSQQGATKDAAKTFSTD